MSVKDHTAQIPSRQSENPATWLKPGEPLMAGGYDWSWCYVWFKPVNDAPEYRIGFDGSFWTCYEPGSHCVSSTWRRMRCARGGTGRRYHIASYQNANGRRTRNLHAMVLEHFWGTAPSGFVCRHLNGDSTNNHFDNLKWGTVAENAQDTIRHGRNARGGATRKITDDEAREAHSLYRAGWLQKTLAARYGVNQATIWSLLVGRTFKHIAKEFGVEFRVAS